MSNHKFVLIIALSEYHDPELLCLPGVRCDAERLRDTFERYTDGGVYRFYWLLDEKASKQAILEAVGEIRELAGDTDQVIVYFGGHGWRMRNEYYFLPYDASFASPASQGISTDELAEMLNTLHAQELVVILDCCHSGGMTNLAWANDRLEELLAGWRSYYVMAASRGREQAGEDDFGGFFMQAICDALQGKGITPDPEGRISAQKAWSHAADVADKNAAQRGFQQRPVSAGIGSPIYLTRPKRSGHGHLHKGIRFGALAAIATLFVLLVMEIFRPKITSESESQQNAAYVGRNVPPSKGPNTDKIKVDVERTEMDRLYQKYRAEGDSLFEQRNFKQAQAKYQLAIEQKPGDHYAADKLKQCNNEIAKDRLYQAYRAEGDSLFEQRNFEQAKKKYQSALEQKPGDHYVTDMLKQWDTIVVEELKKRGDALFNQERYIEAQNSYIQALTYRPDDETIQERLDLVEIRVRFVDLRDKPLESLRYKEVKNMIREYNFYAATGYEWSNPEDKGVTNYFSLQENGQVVLDRATGLFWQQSGSEFVTYATAGEHINGLNSKKFSGFDDWRLPTLEEAMTLLEPQEKNHNLHIDSVFDSRQNAIWTADKLKSTFAWIVSFTTGNCHPASVTVGLVIEELKFVRAVRKIR